MGSTRDWCDDRRVIEGISVLMESFCILTALVNAQTYTGDEVAEN